MKVKTPTLFQQLRMGDEHVERFRALAHPNRLRVFYFLVLEREGMTVGELQARVGLPWPTLSHHLDHLRRAGLLERRRDARFINYRINRRVIADLVRILRPASR
jgi:DNA-binding transcriptional ArsR family regulator